MGASHACKSHEFWSHGLHNKPVALKVLRLLDYYYNITKKKTVQSVKFKFKANFNDSVGENGE